jgi:hypothetical protein
MARFLVGERGRNTKKPKFKNPKEEKITLLQGNKTYGEHTSISNSKNF